MSRDALNQTLLAKGLQLLGGFKPQPTDQLNLPGSPVTTLFLVGHVGKQLEQLFAQGMSGTDPLDAWSTAQLDPLARAYQGKALYPFEGPPYHPFQSWALRTGCFYPSAIRILIHPRFGLWHAFRGALLLPGNWELASEAAGENPCQSCQRKPCLSTCPVNAFTPDGYAVQACVNHLTSKPGNSCQDGCQARLACPVGETYGPHQRKFHMNAFVNSYAKLESS